MAKKILYIRPVANNTMDDEICTYLQAFAEDDTRIDVAHLPKGPQHLEYAFYQALAGTELLKKIRRAEMDSYDAAIIGCFDDPFLYEAREICQKMLVVAPAEASMHIAATLGNRFSVIVGRDKWIPQMTENAHKYGLAAKLASFRSVGLGVPDFHAQPERAMEKIRSEIGAAIKDDLAEVIILGCTMQFGFFQELQKQFSVPIIDIMVASLKYAEMLVELKQKAGWYTSKAGLYSTPPLAEIQQWGLEQDFGYQGLFDE